MMNSVKEIFDAMPDSFQPDAAAEIDAVYQFDITGEGGGQWHAIVRKGTLEIVEGRHGSPSATITAEARNYLDVANGKRSETMAFATGKLRVSGSIPLAMKLNRIFKRK